MNFDQTEFKNPSFLKAVLQQAVDAADHQIRLALMRQAQVRSLESQQIEALKRSMTRH